MQTKDTRRQGLQRTLANCRHFDHSELQQADGKVEYVSYLAEEFELLRVELARP